MTDKQYGLLRVLKEGDHPSIFELRPNIIFTIGSRPQDDIRLKVQSSVPEYSILETESEGMTTFTNKGITSCQINDISIDGTRYLIPGDVLDLCGKLLRYENPQLTQQAIEFLQKENKKLLPGEELKGMPIRKRYTMHRNNSVGSPLVVKGPKTPMQKQRYVVGTAFLEEDIENYPVTPSKTNKKPCVSRGFITPLSTPPPQLIRNSSDNQDNSLLDSFKCDETDTADGIQNYNDDQPPDLIPMEAFTAKITDAAHNISMLTDVSNPFSDDFSKLPDLNNESLLMGDHLEVSQNKPSDNSFGRMTSPLKATDNRNVKGTPVVEKSIKTPKSILKVRSDFKPNDSIYVPGSITKNDLSKTLSGEITADYSMIESPLKATDNRNVNVQGTPVVEKSIKTPKSILKVRSDFKPNDSIYVPGSITKNDLSKTLSGEITTDYSMIEATPARRVTRSSSLMTPSTKRNSTIPNSERKVLSVLSDSTNIMNSPAMENKLARTPYVRLINDRPVCLTSPRRYSENSGKKNIMSRRYSEVIDNRPKNLSSSISSSTSSYAVRTSSFITNRRSRNPSCTSLNTEEKDVDIIVDDYLSGSSSDHYNSDREIEKDDEVEFIGSDVYPTLKEDSQKHPSPDYVSSSEHEISSDKSSDDYSSGSSPLHYESSDTSSLPIEEVEIRGVKRNWDQRESPNGSIKKVSKKRRMSALNPVPIEDIQELLNVSEDTSRSSLKHVTSYDEIKDLLDVSPKNDLTDVRGVRNLMKTPKLLRTPKNDLMDVSGVKQLLATPIQRKTPRNKATPKPMRLSENDLNDVGSVKKITGTPRVGKTPKTPSRTPKIQNQPEDDLANVSGVKKLLITPIRSPRRNDMEGVKRVIGTRSQKTPKNDLDDVRGVKRLLATPKVYNPPKDDLSDVRGVKKLLKTPKVQRLPENDLSEIKGVKKLMATPKPQNPPNDDLSDVRGVKRLLKTPKIQRSPSNDLRDIRGVKKLMATPKPQNPPNDDLSDVRGVKRLLKTPKIQRSPSNDLRDIRGVKKLMATPKPQNPPKDDLSDVRGVKKLLKTPKARRSPENDLRNVIGVKKLMATPKVQNPPKDDLSDVRGVKKLLKTPKVQRSPENDLRDIRGVKKLMATPKPQNPPRNDLSHVGGIKKLFATPKIRKPPQKTLATPRPQKPPKNDLSDLRGVKQLLGTPKIRKSPKNDLSDLDGVKDLFQIDDDEIKEEIVEIIEINDDGSDDMDPFDKLLNKKSVRTYQAKSLSPEQRRKSVLIADVSPSVLEWVDGQNKRLSDVESDDTKSGRDTAKGNGGKRKYISEESTSEEVSRPVRQTRRKKLEVATASCEQDSGVSTRRTRRNNNKTDQPKTINKEEETAHVEPPPQQTDVEIKTRPKRGRKNVESAADVDVPPVLSPPARRTRRAVKEHDAKKQDQEEAKPPQKRNVPSRKEKIIDETNNNNKKQISASDNSDIVEVTEVVSQKSNYTNDYDSKDSSYDEKSAKSKKTKAGTRKKPVRKIVPKSATKDDTDQDEQIESTPATTSTPKRRGKRPQRLIETNQDESLTKQVLKSTTKKQLYNPELHTEIEQSSSTSVDEAGGTKTSLRTKSNRCVNLPKMLDIFEVALGKKSFDGSTGKKPTPKRGGTKRKGDVEKELDVEQTRVTRSRRKKN